MPRKTPKPREVAGKTPALRPNRRALTPKQAREPSNLSRHHRNEHQDVRPLKFPGRLGGR